jgi:hypothetical protein
MRTAKSRNHGNSLGGGSGEKEGRETSPLLESIARPPENMRKMFLGVCVALVVLPSVFLFQWELDTVLHVSTGFLAGVLIMEFVTGLRK